MSRLIVPVKRRILYSTGDVCLWCDLEVLLKDSSGGLVPDRLRVDTGTDVTTFPAYLAKKRHLPSPQRATAGARHVQTGLAIRSGILSFRIVGMDATEYAVACLFLGDPDNPPSPQAPIAPKLLQPFQLLGQLRFVFEKDPALGNAYGELVIEKV
jgi:hypothetical protein